MGNDVSITRVDNSSKGSTVKRKKRVDADTNSLNQVNAVGSVRTAKSLRSGKSNKSRHEFDPQFVERIRVSLERQRTQQPTRLEERNDKILIFKTPTMRAKATVTVPPVPRGEVWTVGWVQSCTYMNFVNVYGPLGFSSWEFPQLNAGFAGINDSDGEFYPFYGHDKEICQIAGPTSKESVFTVSMSDSPTSHVTLKAPCKPAGSQHSIDLTDIRRCQKFKSWLVAHNDITGECHEIICMEWECDINIKCKKDSSPGSRSSLREPLLQGVPQTMKKIVRIPPCAKMPPTANYAQMLVWRPHDSAQNMAKIRIIVSPTDAEGLPYIPTEREMRNKQVYDLAMECLNFKDKSNNMSNYMY